MMRSVRTAVVMCGLVFAGCAGHYYPLADMTAEQIKAAVSAKETSVTCITATYAGAKGTTIFINSDKGIPAGVTINDDCKTTFDTKPVPK